MTASFLYYCFEVNVMNWIKKYGWFIFIAFVAGMLGNTFCTFIEHVKNWGSVADWVSGIGSLIAITFAYWQIIEQKKEYENDKKIKREDDILKNRAFFDVRKSTYVVKNKDIVWISIEDKKNKKVLECIYKKYNDEKAEKDKKAENIKYTLANNSYVYVFRNITKASAYSFTLKIEYKVNEESEYDYIQSNIGIMSGEEICILPSKLINEPSKYANCQKKLSIYFESMDKKVYYQTWEEKNMAPKNDIIDFEFDGITTIKKSEKPKEGHSVFLSLD